MIIVISGTSGAGKTSIIKELLGKGKELALAVSATTREIRPGEQDGREYYFLSLEQFRAKEAAAEFLETADVHGNLYGTLRTELERIRALGKDVLLDVDVQGAASVRKLEPGCLAIFIRPPGLAELRRRLVKRGTEGTVELERRLADALQELEVGKGFKHQVDNEVLATAVEQVAEIIETARSRGISK